MNTTRYIAKCRACGCHTSGLTAGQDARRSKSDPQRGGSVYTSGMGSIVIDCRKCGQARRAFPVRGIVSLKHECNEKCMSSTGTVCECSCGGKNHGGSYAAA
jgi:hypothetical protein